MTPDPLLVGAKAPLLVGRDQTDSFFDLAENRRGYTLVWWQPDGIRSGCQPCSAGTRSALTELRGKGVQVVGVNHAAPAENFTLTRQAQIDIFIVSVDQDTAAAWGVAKGAHEEWTHIPRRIAYLLDPDGEVVRVYHVTNPEVHLNSVLIDVNKLQDEPRGRGLLSRLLHR